LSRPGTLGIGIGNGIGIEWGGSRCLRSLRAFAVPLSPPPVAKHPLPVPAKHLLDLA
jgi:hypothetical protein